MNNDYNLRSESPQYMQQHPKFNIAIPEQQNSTQKSNKINSKEQVSQLIEDLNKAISPQNTNIKFGVDSHDIFFVSVIESQTNKMIRRFPVEQLADAFPKTIKGQGILFDSTA